MESEKVKEIKELLKEEILIATSFDDKLRRVSTKFLQDILTLINELEEENEKIKNISLNEEITVGEYLREMQRLKDRVAELEKEKTEQLREFAERLKERLKDNVNSDNVDDYVECAIYIDETLKERTEGI